MLAPLLFLKNLKPGSAMISLPGVHVSVLDINDNKKLEGNDIYGKFTIESSWPGQTRGVWGDKDRFKSVYFAPTPGN